MSGWRLLLIELAAGDGQPRCLSSDGWCWNDINRAEEVGVIERCGDGPRGPGHRVLHVISQTGRDFLENRVHQVESRPGGRRWVPTWLHALPRGLRIGVPETWQP